MKRFLLTWSLFGLYAVACVACGAKTDNGPRPQDAVYNYTDYTIFLTRTVSYKPDPNRKGCFIQVVVWKAEDQPQMYIMGSNGATSAPAEPPDYTGATASEALNKYLAAADKHQAKNEQDTNAPIPLVTP